VRLEVLDKLKNKINYHIGIRNRDLQDYNIEPQRRNSTQIEKIKYSGVIKEENSERGLE
jgi:hypothetical protein